MSHCYAFANQKGGVGKTTSVVNIAGVMANLGYRVLVVDVDPQSNCTTSFGIDARSLPISIYDVLLGDHTASEAILPTKWDNLFILPSVPA